MPAVTGGHFFESIMAERGRPEIEFDMQRVEDFGKLALSNGEMASLFGCHIHTIERRVNDKEGEFWAAYSKGLSNTKKALRTKQIQMALSGDRTMLIWLGKQLLDQAEKIEQTNREVSDDDPVKVGVDSEWLEQGSKSAAADGNG